MRGSVVGQASFLMSFVKAFYQSKHEAKIQARQDGYRDWHSVGKQLGIYSNRTAERYFAVWKELGNFMKENGVKTFDKITPEVIKAYLENKMNKGLSKETLRITASAIEKLEVALNKYAEKYNLNTKYDFKEVLNPFRKEVSSLKSEVKSRAYSSPEKIIDNLKTKDYKVVAEVQYKAGARIHEIAIVKSDQLKGYKKDIDGQEKGVIGIKGKGGKYRELLVPKEAYNYIKDRIDKNGVWKIDKASYGEELRQACYRASESYKGSHGLRWNYAEERLKVQTKHTGDFNVALGEVSKDMGHDRADITLHYLKR